VFIDFSFLLNYSSIYSNADYRQFIIYGHLLAVIAIIAAIHCCRNGAISLSLPIQAT